MTTADESAIRALIDTRSQLLNGDQCRHWFAVMLKQIENHRRFARSQAERISAQSELLSKKSEKPKGEI